MLTAAQVLLTIVVLGVGLIPVRADLNRTHATNPHWVGHARFHVVWQVVSYAGLALLALCLLWIPGAERSTRAVTVGVIALCILVGFFAAVAGRPRYDGALADDNGYPPVHLGGRAVDLNVLTFSVLVVVLALAWVLLALA